MHPLLLVVAILGLLGIGLILTGIAMLAGAAWALIAGGVAMVLIAGLLRGAVNG